MRLIPVQIAPSRYSPFRKDRTASTPAVTAVVLPARRIIFFVEKMESVTDVFFNKRAFLIFERASFKDSVSISGSIF